MSLLVWLPLNGNLDNWGSSPAKFSVVGSGIATATTGKTTPNSYQRTTANTNGYITSDINFTMSGDMTLACWCKVTAIGSAGTANGIITQHGHQTGGLGITIKDVGTQDFRICANTGLYGDSHGSNSNRTYHKYYGNTNIFNAWHHLCVTYKSDTKQLRMYVDGNPETITFSDTGATGIVHTLAGNNTTARPFRIFDWSTDHSSNGSYKPPCYLNDVRMYDHCLSPKEVKLLGQGLVAHYKLDGGGNNNLLVNTYNPTSTSSLVSVPSTCTVAYDNDIKLNVFHSSTTSTGETYIYSSRTPVIKKSTQYTFSCDIWVNDYVKSIEFFWLSDTDAAPKTGSGYVNITNTGKTIEKKNGWFHLTWTFTTKADDRTGYIRIDNNGSSTSGTAAIMKVTNMKLELGSQATPFSLSLDEANFNLGDDCSGYKNNGTAIGSFVLDSNSPRHKCCTIFDGSTTKIELPIKALMQTLLAQQCTINFWVNEANLNSRSVYFGGYSGSNFNIEMENTKFRVYWNGSPDMYCAANTVPQGEWAMYTVVTDVNSGIKVYKNGAHLQSHNAALTNITSGFSNNTFRIGSDSRTGDTMAECKMSDFRIYCSALSANDIKTLYESGGSVTNQGGLIAYDINESMRQKAQMYKKGVFNAESFSERGQLADMKCMIFDGAAWARVFYHKNNGGTTMFSTSASEVLNTNVPNKFSRMYLLPHLKGTDGKLELLLLYPTNYPGQYNRWKQTNAPQDEYVTTTSDGSGVAAGYSAVHIDWNTYYWGGLTRQGSDVNTAPGSSCYISGSVGHGNWFYAIGANTAWGGGIPAHHGSNGVEDVELWVRIDTLPYNKKLSIMKEQYVSSSLLQEI